MALKPTRETAGIVLLGSFNPSIFQPSWLALREIIRADAVDSATVNVIAPQIADFVVSGLKMQVLPAQFIAEAHERQDHPRLRDLVVSIFTVLAETPIKRMGFNWTFRYQLADAERWHAVGDQLAPKSFWSGLVPDRVGLKTMAVTGPVEPEGSGNTLNVEVFGHANNTIELRVNHDFPLPGDYAGSESEYFLNLVRSRWDKSAVQSSTLVQTLMQKLGAF